MQAGVPSRAENFPEQDRRWGGGPRLAWTQRGRLKDLLRVLQRLGVQGPDPGLDFLPGSGPWWGAPPELAPPELASAAARRPRAAPTPRWAALGRRQPRQAVAEHQPR